MGVSYKGLRLALAARRRELWTLPSCGGKGISSAIRRWDAMKWLGHDCIEQRGIQQKGREEERASMWFSPRAESGRGSTMDGDV